MIGYSSLSSTIQNEIFVPLHVELESDPDSNGYGLVMPHFGLCASTEPPTHEGRGPQCVERRP